MHRCADCHQVKPRGVIGLVSSCRVCSLYKAPAHALLGGQLQHHKAKRSRLCLAGCVMQRQHLVTTPHPAKSCPSSRTLCSRIQGQACTAAGRSSPQLHHTGTAAAGLARQQLLPGCRKAGSLAGQPPLGPDCCACALRHLARCGGAAGGAGPPQACPCCTSQLRAPAAAAAGLQVGASPAVLNPPAVLLLDRRGTGSGLQAGGTAVGAGWKHSLPGMTPVDRSLAACCRACDSCQGACCVRAPACLAPGGLGDSDMAVASRAW